MRLLAPLLIASSIFGQDVIEEEIVFHVTSPEVVACPPRYTPMNCQRSVEIEPDLWYQTCESEIRGNENVWIVDDSGEERYVLMPDQLRFSTELEKWTNKRNKHVIDVRFRLTVKRHASGYGSYNFVTRLDMCPFPETHVQGNIHWDWKDAYQWYGENATVEEWALYQQYGIINSGMQWRTRGSFGSGGDLYFGCRKIRGKMYDGPTPSFSSRDIEWNGQMWRSRFPETYPANIKLQPPCEYSFEEPDSNEFAINMQITMSGRHVIASMDGEMLPKSEQIHVPNVVQFEAWAQFTIMDPLECPPKYEDDGGDSSMDEVIP